MDEGGFIERFSQWFAPNPAACRVLSSFGGLNVISLPRKFIVFDASLGIDLIQPRDAAFVRELQGADAFPVASGVRYFYFVAGDGSVLAVQDEWDYYWKAPDFSSAMDFHFDLRRPHVMETPEHMT